MPLYLDACAIIKKYIDEGDGGGAVMDGIMARPALWGSLSSSEWLLLEVFSTLAKKLREGHISQRQFPRLVETFRTDVETLNLIEIESGDIAAAAELVRAFPQTRFHTGDAIHLHTLESLREALTGEPLVLVTADKSLRNLATSRGFQVFNPSVQTMEELRALYNNR